MKQFKKAALNKYRVNFITIVFVTFVVSFLTAEGANSVALIRRYDYKVEQADNVVNYAKKITQEQFLNNLIADIIHGSDESRNEETVQLLQDLRSLGNSLLLEAITELLPESRALLSGYSATREIVKYDNIIRALGIISSNAISILFVVFAGNLLLIGKRRFYMDLGTEKTESENKHKNPIFKLFFAFRKGDYSNCVRVMFFRGLYQLLWGFTIVGGFMKLYEYRVIPYILADNPSLTKKEVFALAKHMTKGYKWKIFLVDLEFLPWQLVQMMTFGILGIVFVNPYYYATQMECYNFLAENCRVNALNMTADSSEHNIFVNTGLIIEDWRNSFAKRTKSVIEKYNPFRSYDLPTLILLFITFSMIGWLWEVILHIIQTGDFVKRGVLNGMWLPIYGFGGCMALIFMKKRLHRPVVTFFSMMVMYGVLEYGTSYILELIYGVRWWDYTGYFMNINGRIYLEGILIFAFAGCAVVYFVAPLLGKVFDKINKKVKVILCVVLMGLFITDTIFSAFKPNMGKGITSDMNQEMEEMINEG